MLPVLASGTTRFPNRPAVPHAYSPHCSSSIAIGKYFVSDRPTVDQIPVGDAIDVSERPAQRGAGRRPGIRKIDNIHTDRRKRPLEVIALCIGLPQPTLAPTVFRLTFEKIGETRKLAG
jgi:hypothetical protein